MSKFANVQMASAEQMTLPEIDQAKSDVIAALDGADNRQPSQAENSAFNEFFGAVTGITPAVMALQAVAGLAQPQAEPTQTRDFLTGQKKGSRFITSAQAGILIKRAEPVVRAAQQATPLMPAHKRSRAKRDIFGMKIATPRHGMNLTERANIASSSLRSPAKGKKISPAAVDALKNTLGRLLRAENHLSITAIASAPSDDRAARSRYQLSAEQQTKVAAKKPEPPMPQHAAPKPPAPSATTLY